MSNTRNVVILGATSSIARAIAGEFGRKGYGVILGARDAAENESMAADVRVRCCVDAHALTFDAVDFESHRVFFEQCQRIAGDSIEGVVLCFGFLDAQAVAQKDFVVAKRTIDVNFTACVSILEIFAEYFEQRRSGFITAVSSVAGDKGRQSNYIYGSAKAGLNAYLQGLRNRMFHYGVQVTTIKPGFVDTKMTFGMPGLFLVASPEKVGRSVFSAITAGKNVAYVPGFWRHIMFIFQHIPESVFKRLKT